jgi:16S rRNA processing protein RimM
MDLLLVGVVMKAHGLRGEVAVLPHHPDSPLWRAGTTFQCVSRELADRATDGLVATPLRTLTVRACRPQTTGGEIRMLCTFEGVESREAADVIRELHLAIPREALPPAGEDEFYHHELTGFTVKDTTGRVLGTVVGVFPQAAQDLIEVAPAPEPDAGKKGVAKRGAVETWFFPFVDAFVRDVDRATKTIVLDPPEGLIP